MKRFNIKLPEFIDIPTAIASLGPDNTAIAGAMAIIMIAQVVNLLV